MVDDETNGVPPPPIVEDDPQVRAVFARLHGVKTVHDPLGIAYTHVSRDLMGATLRVTDRVAQPMGLLHGGVSVLVAESLCSLGAVLNVPNAATHTVVGLEINANHVRQAPVGETVTATARPVHRGRTTQVWAAELRTASGALSCIARCTLAVIPIAKRAAKL
jgi:1,4-dihydroxy-2-naphthoyl-CoA hydrolase